MGGRWLLTRGAATRQPARPTCTANARLTHHRPASIAYANAGANYAHTADKLLVAAGKLLR